MPRLVSVADNRALTGGEEMNFATQAISVEVGWWPTSDIKSGLPIEKDGTADRKPCDGTYLVCPYLLLLKPMT